MPDPGDLGPFKEPKMGELNPKMVEYDEAPFLPSGISPIEAISAVVQHSARQQPLQSTASAMNAKVIYAKPISSGDIPPGDYYAPLAAAALSGIKVIRALVSVPEAGDAMCLFPDLNRVNGGGQLSVLDKTILAMYRVAYGPVDLIGVEPGAIIKISDNHILSVVDSPFSAGPPSPEAAVGSHNSFENGPASMELQDVYSGRNPNEENSNFFEEPALEVMKDKSDYPDSPLLAAVGTPYSWGAGTTYVKSFWPNGDWSYFFLADSSQPAIAAQTAPGYDCSGFAQAALVTLGHIPDGFVWPGTGPFKRDGNTCGDATAGHIYYLANQGTPGITMVNPEDVERGDLAMYPGHVEVVNGPMKPDGLIEIIGASGGGSKTYSNNRKAYVKIKSTHLRGGSGFKGFVRVRAGST